MWDTNLWDNGIGKVYNSIEFYGVASCQMDSYG